MIINNKLHLKNNRGNVHELLTSYLSDRKQNVKVKSSVIDSCNITIGVPQGTVIESCPLNLNQSFGLESLNSRNN